MKTAKILTSSVLIFAFVVGCATQRNPFDAQVPAREIEAVQALALNTVFESHAPPSSVFPEVNPPQAICLGVGQRGLRSNSQWLNQHPRETYWDPTSFLRGQLTSATTRIVPLSACRRDGDHREMYAETETPLVTFFVANPTWTTPDIAGVTVSIRGLGRYNMVYSLALRRSGGDWRVRRFSCRWAGAQCEHFR